MTTETTSVNPITSLTATDEQHLLFLFLPIGTGASEEAVGALHTLLSGKPANDGGGNGNGSAGSDPRTATGVHFFMTYFLSAAGSQQQPPPPFPVFQLPPPNPETKAARDLLVVMSIYDADFGPYIGAFTSDESFAGKLDLLLGILDETGFIDPSDPTSAKGIIANGGTFQNQDAFVTLLMRYNWADPTIPAATLPQNIAHPNPSWKYFLGATFPGMTNTKILNPSAGYPNALQLYPVDSKPIDFAPSTPPSS
ncbi:MAG TPA: hypothetical protein VK400_11365 [Pyrinomonadaceae bacterium]|nr:hypothetical protein [Pyrinomonadaceae bacterium]